MNENYIENIYFYLVKYTNEHFLWICPYIYENYLFKYPLPISIKNDQTIFNINSCNQNCPNNVPVPYNFIKN